MRVAIVAVGRLRPGPEQALVRHYAERLNWPLAILEVEEKRPLPAAERRARESRLLLGAVPKGASIVALDANGKSLASEAFAAKLAQWRDGGTAEIAFLIGGADGLAPELLQKANFVLSLGSMTWPHLLVRGMLLEQLYRAQQILAGHPYHRG